MKNNKGFTLIELLAVMVILGVITAITIPIIINVLQSGKEELYELQIDNIKKGARTWAAENMFNLPEESNQKITLTLGQLKAGGYVEIDIRNPKTKQFFPNDMEITITYYKDTYIYEVLEETGTPVEYQESIDINAPIIVLRGSASDYVEFGETYEDPGVLANGASGANITAQVSTIISSNNVVVSLVDTTKFEQYKITYTVEDNGKTATAIRTVTVKDTVPPILTIPADITILDTDVANFDVMTGVSATDNSDEEVTITTSGNIGSIPDVYTVTYTATDIKGNKTTKQRNVTVSPLNIVFNVNPAGLSQSKTVTINYPEREVGYIYEYSLDNALTWQEVVSPAVIKELTFTSSGTIIARIKDGSNEIKETSFEVSQIDSIPPVITVDPLTVTIFRGTTYTDSGVTATDNTMGVITSDIITTGTVDTNTVGTYTLKYNVSDLAGNNATEVTRQVNIIESTFTFTNAGQTGYTGPSQTQVNSTYLGTSLEGKVTVSGGIQLWTVPYTGNYRIEVYGAQGGNSYNMSSITVIGGKGAQISGDFQLTEGQAIKVLVGQKGIDNYNSARGAGGGGGSYVYNNNTSTLLIAAGGGGGAGDYDYTSNMNGTTSTNGQPGSSTSSTSGGGLGGTNGYGGATMSYPGGGAGWVTNGADSSYGKGGKRFLEGGVGGIGYSDGVNGGFGGGGGSYAGAGGGGGYSGGGGGNWSYSGAGGGGGSYNLGTNQSNSSGVNTGHGKVVITIVN